MKLARHFGFVISLACACLCPAHADEIPWHAGKTFSRTSVDDDIRSVLRALIGDEGLSVIFRPGVEGKISFQFRDVAPETVFQQIVADYGLTGDYNPRAKTVTISPLKTGAGAVSRRFINLRTVEFSTVRDALVNFGLGLQGIAFDATTKTLAMAGDEQRLSQITDLVKTLEERTQPRINVDGEPANVETEVIRLRFADVGPSVRTFHGQRVTVPGILETLKTLLGGSSSTPSAGAQISEAAPSTSMPVQIPAGLSAVASRLLSNANADSPTLPPTAGAPTAPTGVRRPTISIDQRTNSVIVRGTPEQIAMVKSVLQQIDEPVQMVEIEVIIATAQVGVSSELGVAWRGLGKVASSTDRGFGFDTGTNGGQATASTGFDPITLLPVPNTGGGTVASFLLRSGPGFLQAQLQALAAQNKARLLSAPRLVTLDNVTARITRAQDIYVPVDTGGLNGQGLSQIQTGLTLEITPSIVPAAPNSGEQLVRLSLNATDSAPTPGGPGGQISVASREVQTDVLVPDGGTFVIGGLFDHTNNQNESGVPVLKNIPLLGQLFRDDASQYNLGETIFFITPRVVREETMRKDIALTSEAVATVGEQRRMLGRLSQKLDAPDRVGMEHSSVEIEEDQ